MTTLEILLSEHNAIIQKIIVEAKKEVIGTTASTSNVNVGIGTNSSNINSNQKLDLFSHISSNFDNLIKEKKEKNKRGRKLKRIL